MSEPAAKEVLLVENNPADVYLMQKAFAECGADIRLSIMPDGREALTFLRKEVPFTQAPTPALIISDLNLPRLHGYELLQELRRLPVHQTTPLVIFSATPEDMTKVHCLRLGANEYVQKLLTCMPSL